LHQFETIGGPNKKNDKDLWILLELNRDFRTVPHEAQFDQLSSRENGKSHGYNQLADACIDGPYIK
ncbi:MAG: hypothetical protein WB853_18705, partial [Desulfobacterales bacterium]